MTEPTKNYPLLKKYFKGKSFENLLAIQNSDPKEIKDVIENIELMMEDFAEKISYTQIRNILQLVKNKKFKNDLGAFYKVLPILAYMEARLTKSNEGRKIISFIRNLAASVQSELDEKTQEEKQYKSFLDIMNTIVAYHKLNA